MPRSPMRVTGVRTPDPLPVFASANPPHRVLAALETHGPMRRRDLMATTGISDNHIGFVLRVLQRWGCIRRVGNGVWEAVP